LLHEPSQQGLFGQERVEETKTRTLVHGKTFHLLVASCELRWRGRVVSEKELMVGDGSFTSLAEM